MASFNPSETGSWLNNINCISSSSCAIIDVDEPDNYVWISSGQHKQVVRGVLAEWLALADKLIAGHRPEATTVVAVLNHIAVIVAYMIYVKDASNVHYVIKSITRRLAAPATVDVRAIAGALSVVRRYML